MTNTARFTTVAEAAKFLDKQVEGWAKKIDLDLLDMGHWGKCVLGQLYGNWAVGLARFDLKYGIEKALFGYEYADRLLNVPECTQLWIKEIKARLAPAKTRQQELEENIAAMQKELEDLKNPKISVTLSKSDWKNLVDILQTVGRTGGTISSLAEVIENQVGEQA
jgi:hypothetical protein